MNRVQSTCSTLLPLFSTWRTLGSFLNIFNILIFLSNFYTVASVPVFYFISFCSHESSSVHRDIDTTIFFIYIITNVLIFVVSIPMSQLLFHLAFFKFLQERSNWTPYLFYRDNFFSFWCPCLMISRLISIFELFSYFSSYFHYFYSNLTCNKAILINNHEIYSRNAKKECTIASQCFIYTWIFTFQKEAYCLSIRK